MGKIRLTEHLRFTFNLSERFINNLQTVNKTYNLFKRLFKL